MERDWWTRTVGFYADKVSHRLAGQMNVLIQPVSENRTQVRVQVRYIFGSFVFDTGSEATVRIPHGGGYGGYEPRTCRPTYRAERDVLEAFSALSDDE